MKEHCSDPSSDMPKGKGSSLKSLKSLLKKPGQTKPKGQKNRVVINEKLNEFFAADYIILIKEECCADYEEECDCCCQEHEMIRLGNCKECRAELNLQFAGGGRPLDTDSAGGQEQLFANVDGLEEVEARAAIEGPPRSRQVQKQHQRQQETLSPPEGYKDVCDEGESDEVDHHLPPHPICAECNYYHQQTAETEPEESQTINAGVNGIEIEPKRTSPDDNLITDEDATQDTSDQTQQTTPDLHQRYLVETITMTTVTERRIVRELGGEDGNGGGGGGGGGVLEEGDSGAKRVSGILKNNKLANSPHSSSDSKDEGSVRFEDVSTPLAKPVSGGEDEQQQQQDNAGGKVVHKVIGVADLTEKESGEGDAAELSLTFKLGNVSLVSNSLKPNSAVRQLFPDPRFISPPPAPSKSVLPVGVEDQSREEDDPEGQKFLITTESLRLFDAVKRAKLAGVQGETDAESTTIRKTIERNALRRSLISKYEPNAKKKSLRSKEFTLEERIRQLTCLDLDDRDNESSASENTTTGDSCSEYLDFPVRTSPSGEEAKSDSSSRCVSVTTTAVSCTVSNSLQQVEVGQGNNPSPQGNLQHQSTYRKITDLFAQKKMEAAPDSTVRNLPDLGIGNKLGQQPGREYNNGGKTPIAKMNSDARKQFLASLAPLSCVAGTGIENREDYYQLSSAKMTGSGNSRDSVGGYNSDSSYSLEDIEAALRGEERNYRNAGDPPDVTRGTPTSNAGDEDSATDELLAFVEQDKTRTERIKKRYNEAEETQQQNEAEDEDDELNDYGFNRRPSVRGIKPKFGSTNEILRQLQSRSVAPGALIEAGKAGSHLSWPSYYNENEVIGDKSSSRIFLQDEEDDTYHTITDGRDSSNTINRINTMQRQIDDIYQTIAETAASVQGSVNRGSYLESTLPRSVVRPPVNGDCGQRYSPGVAGDQPKINGQHPHPLGARMLRIAGGGDPGQGTMYNTLPGKSTRRHTFGYHCEIGTVPPGLQQPPEAKCYRTMYLLPYNGMSDPTYQNIQRILPAHAAPPANYANHVDRYPYPRNNPCRKIEEPSTRYYAARPVSANPTTASLYSAQSAQLHLHLHQPVVQPDEMRVPNTLPLHHNVHSLHHQHQTPAGYGLQSVPYSACANPVVQRGAGPGGGGGGGGGYHYQLHLGRGAADVQTQTGMINALPPPCSNSSSATSSPMCAAYNNAGVVPGGPLANNAVLSSPTKIQQHHHHQQQQQRAAVCNVAERGVPEGAASAPSHDFLQNNSSNQVHAPGPIIGHSNNGPPPNTQNSVYYAMNV
ncbi:uncharacterized protein [Neodiprion pinetum]|uniref:uncharacterized protein isoform X1 n=1 Tax=Neodiprion pinetum TaxID=441929 RepID=UPI001EDF6ECF|nr:uncharacterized protein LOC124215801 isoform X1 [Neodiprion pinetum]